MRVGGNAALAGAQLGMFRPSWSAMNSTRSARLAMPARVFVVTVAPLTLAKGVTDDLAMAVKRASRPRG